MASPVELICLPGSPWTAKTQWILHHCGILFSCRALEPVVDEIWLRYKLGLWPWHRQFWRRFTVPIAILRKANEPTRILTDSYDIAEWAMTKSTETSLDLTKIRAWNQVSNALLEYGRAAFIKAAKKDVRVAIEVLSPPWMKKLPTTLVVMIMKVAVRVFAFKYRYENDHSSENTVLLGLDQIRSTIQRGQGQYLVDDKFSYADIVMAIAVNGSSPSDDVFQFTIPSKYGSEVSNLLKDYQDVKDWKNAVIKQHLPEMLRRRPSH